MNSDTTAAQPADGATRDGRESRRGAGEDSADKDRHEDHDEDHGQARSAVLRSGRLRQRPGRFRRRPKPTRTPRSRITRSRSAAARSTTRRRRASRDGRPEQFASRKPRCSTSRSRRTTRRRKRARSRSSITAGRGRRRCSCCSARSRRAASRRRCRASRRPRRTDGGQPGQPDRQERPRLHQSGRHRLFGGDRAEQEPRFLGRRPGRGLDQAVHQALSDEEQPLEFAEVPVRRVVRHGAQLRAGVPLARGRRRSERHHAAIVDSRLHGKRAIRSARCRLPPPTRGITRSSASRPTADRISATFAEEVAQFARTDYLAALRKFPTDRRRRPSRNSASTPASTR